MPTLEEIKAKLPSQCKILAVSKLQSSKKILELYQYGQRLFGENYAQEALKKMTEIKKSDVQWHFIGRLQKNKIKQIVGTFELIHSVDSIDLLRAIDQQAANKNLRQKILIQVNLSDETTKGGVPVARISETLAETTKFLNLQVVGLMTMPPLFDDAEKARPYFRQLKSLQADQQKKFQQLTELSMGTSADFWVAASEGATIVRLGTILFGERAR
jgi:PLP dependent protein